MAGMDEKTIHILLMIDRQEALYRFLRDYFIPMLSDRGYSFADLLQAIALLAFRTHVESDGSSHLGCSGQVFAQQRILENEK
jgi:hypothetical protein